MKCVRILSSGKVERISDEAADAKVADGSAVFVSKSVWRVEVRDLGKSKTVKEATK